ncbi:MAG: hypothetical protein ACXWTN_03550 [Methylosarcina sp.]
MDIAQGAGQYWSRVDMLEYSLSSSSATIQYRYLGDSEISRKICVVHAPQFRKRAKIKDLIAN